MKKLILTVEQISALKIMLKLEVITRCGTFVKGVLDTKDEIGAMSGIVQNMEVWNQLDRVLTFPVLRYIENPQTTSLGLEAPIELSLSDSEIEIIGNVVNDGHYRETLKLLHSEKKAEDISGMLIAVVILERNVEALQSIFDAEKKNASFSFQQTAPSSTLLN